MPYGDKIKFTNKKQNNNGKYQMQLLQKPKKQQKTIMILRALVATSDQNK